jgi:hypothetical protein
LVFRLDYLEDEKFLYKGGGMENLKGKTLRLKEDLTLVSVEDKAALLDVERRCYYEPNDTAFFLLKLMEDGCLYENMGSGLVSAFDVAEETARLDIDNFIEEVLGLGLIEIGGEAAARQSVGKPKKEKETYQPPLVEHQAGIAVACAVALLTQAD